MKWIAVLFAIGACAPAHIPQLTAVTGFELTSYTAKGFFFSPNIYTGPYEPVGLVTVTIYAEGRADKDGIIQFTPLAGQQVLDTVYARARTMGANGFVQMQFTAVSMQVRSVAVPGLQISGFAIRRKDS